MKRFAIVFVTLAALFGFSAGAAATSDYPPDPPSVTVDNPSLLPGGTIVLGVSGCEPGADITVTIDGSSTIATADPDGLASISVTAPSTPGAYPMTIACGGATTTVNVTVLASGPPTTGGLPTTGSDSTNTTLTLGLGALVIGGGLLGVSQLRRRQSLAG